jgi:hypothetical protein
MRRMAVRKRVRKMRPPAHVKVFFFIYYINCMVPMFDDAWIYESEWKAETPGTHLNITFFMSALPNPPKFSLHGRMNQFEERWTNFHKILYWGEVTQFVCTFQFWLKSGQNNWVASPDETQHIYHRIIWSRRKDLCLHVIRTSLETKSIINYASRGFLQYLHANSGILPWVTIDGV